jgi:hypothetical protein
MELNNKLEAIEKAYESNPISNEVESEVNRACEETLYLSSDRG